MKSPERDPNLRWLLNNTAVSYHEEILDAGFTAPTLLLMFFQKKKIQISGVTSLYFSDWMEYLSIESVNVTHSGEYICQSNSSHTVNTYVKVFGE